MQYFQTLGLTLAYVGPIIPARLSEPALRRYNPLALQQ